MHKVISINTWYIHTHDIYLERSLSKLSTSCKASLPAAWFPQHSVALARWLVSRLDTCRARPECTASVEPPMNTENNAYCPLIENMPGSSSPALDIGHFLCCLHVIKVSSCKLNIPSTFSHSMQRLASTWKAAQAMVATFCFLVCFSFELHSLWPLKLHRLSMSWTSPLRTRHCSSLLW